MIAKTLSGQHLRRYLSLSKPGIIGGNALTAIGGYFLGSHRTISFEFLYMLIGLSCIIASGCAINNCIDKDIDSVMFRTRNRVIVKKMLSIPEAIGFAIGAFITGFSILFFLVNPLSASLATLGFVVYVFVYSFAKYKTHFATLIGSIAGAIPPVVGFCSATNQFDLGAWILFLMISAWQMPHFIAIAIYRREDYEKANLPVLPLIHGIKRAKIEMLLFTVIFSIACVSLYFFQYASAIYLIVSSSLSLYWFYLAIRGFSATDDVKWAKKMFIFSLVIILGISFTMPL